MARNIKSVASDVSYAFMQGSVDADGAYNLIVQKCDKLGLVDGGLKEAVVNLVIYSLREQKRKDLARSLQVYSASSISGAEHGGMQEFDPRDIANVPNNQEGRTAFLNQLLKQRKFAAVQYALDQKPRSEWDGFDFHLAARTAFAKDKYAAINIIREAEAMGQVTGSEAHFAELEAQALEALGKHKESLIALESIPIASWSSYVFCRAIQVAREVSFELMTEYAMKSHSRFPDNAFICSKYLQCCLMKQWKPGQYLSKALQTVQPNKGLLGHIANCAKKGLLPLENAIMLIRHCQQHRLVDERSIKRALSVLETELLLYDELADRNDARSGFFDEAERKDIEPVDRTAYHVLHNQQTPREREGSFHDPPPRKKTDS